MANKLVFDTEYRDSQNPSLTPVCGVVRADGEEHRYWFLNPEEVVQFRKDWDAWMASGYRIICYAASAEARCLLALGYSPKELLSWDWVDPYVFWRMLQHSHPLFRWGRMFITDKITGESKLVTTIQPPRKEDSVTQFIEDDEGNLHPKEPLPKFRTTGLGLAAAVAHRFGVDIGSENKQAMRDLILKNTTYTENQKVKILDYCASDLDYLLPLAEDLLAQVKAFTTTVQDGKTVTPVGLGALIKLSRYMVCTGIIENNGIPFDSEKARKLGANYRMITDESIRGLNEIYPFFVKKAFTRAEIKKGAIGTYRWVESQEMLDNYILGRNYTSWPKTEKNHFKKDRDTLRTFGGDTNIEAFRVVKNKNSQLNRFREEGFARLMQHVGNDGRIRPWLSPFGTKTGRNTPSVSEGFIFAMSTWLRPLCEEAGMVVQGGDYSAQEMLLQGFLAKDENLMKACKSGDPYTWLAQYTRAIPPGVTRSKEGFLQDGELLPKEMQLKYKGIRSTFKSLMLGIGYGMGLEKLAVRLTQSRIESLPPEERQILQAAISNPGPEVKEKASKIMHRVKVVKGFDEDGEEEDVPDHQKATTYRHYHQNTFAAYWAWRVRLIQGYKKRGCLHTSDGWTLFAGEGDTTSGNFIVQGTGAAILRRAVERCILAGLTIISPLHDAIYIVSKPENEESDRKTLVEEMEAAVEDVIGEGIIKVDAKAYRTDWAAGTSGWCEEKQAADFKQFSKYLIR